MPSTPTYDPKTRITTHNRVSEAAIHNQSGQDTTKAPVDTVRLKRDIHKDLDASLVLNNLEGSNKKSNRVDDQPEYRGADALVDRAYARKDTLAQARAGKIPAKKAK